MNDLILRVKFAIAILMGVIFASCASDPPISITFQNDQLDIKGDNALCVHTDTATIAVVRDSIPDESGQYNIRTAIKLVLDSVYPTDDLTERIKLNILSEEGESLAVLYPIDSLLGDTLVRFIQSSVDNKTSITFEGKMHVESFEMVKHKKMTLTGFTFTYANPEITKKINDLKEALDAVQKIGLEAKEYQESAKGFNSLGGGFMYALMFKAYAESIQKMGEELSKKEKDMTPKQLALFQECTLLYVTIFKIR